VTDNRKLVPWWGSSD